MKHTLLILAVLFIAGCSREERKQPEQQQLTKQEQPGTGEALLAEAKAKLSDAKSKLASEGKYGCCIKEPCTMCAMEEGGKCECYEEVKKHEPVCNECYGGWMSGKGSDSTIKKEDVKADFMEKEEH